MNLSTRPPIYSLPSYSLTADLLSFLRCGLQYRYTRIGKLPSTHPIQLWFGQFIHGVLEDAYRQFNEARRQGRSDLPPWPSTRIEAIADLVDQRLQADGLVPWDRELRKLGRARAAVVIQELGPLLFPLIQQAEVRLRGSRALPTAGGSKAQRSRRIGRYEMVGVVDVITHLKVSDPALQVNPLLRAIRRYLPAELPERFELIIDYKGMRRPPMKSSGRALDFCAIYEWQVLTYAHLRARHAESLPILAGVVLYLNELHPSLTDIQHLRRETRSALTDILPESGGSAERLLRSWRRPGDLLPFDFRLDRCVRVVPVTSDSISTALDEFDSVVSRIEACRTTEGQTGRLVSAWETNASDQATCAVCDTRTFCPAYHRITRRAAVAVPSRVQARPAASGKLGRQPNDRRNHYAG